MKDQKFSVAMSVYRNDNPHHFARALQSITEDQTVKPDEIVLVVDGPVGENLNNVIEDYSTKYDVFKVIRLEKNGGLGNALRIAVENCEHELIARMDSDDVSIPTRFEKQVNFMGENDVDIVGGHISEFVGDECNIVSRRDVNISHEEIKADMKKRCAFNHMTVMFKKSAVQSVGGYLSWHYNEDYYLWLRMLLAGCRFANLDQVLVNMRVGEEMYQRRGGWKYFKSEAKLQGFMLKHKVIGLLTYCINVSKRLIVQVLLPNRLRGWVFRKFARKSVDQ